MKHGSKPFNARYYPVPNIKEETLHNKIHGIVEIGVLTHVHRLQYGTPLFIIPKIEDTMWSIMDY